MNSFLNNVIKGIENTNILADGGNSSEFTGTIDTGSYIMNAVLSGSLYGGVPKEFENIPFFREVKTYIFELWDIYKRKGYIETPILKRKVFAKNLTDRNLKPQTLFNYIIQAMETEQNALIIKTINKELKDQQSKLILYTYDALLFDIHPDEINLLKIIKNKMLYPVKCKTGHNYNKMETYNFE